MANTFHHGASIAEHVLMCVLMLSRRVLAADREPRAGRWRHVAVDATLPFGDTLRGRRVGVIGPAELAAMGPQALLVNVARGPVVREEALYEALSAGTIAGAALDVWWAAPPHAPSRLPFHALPNVVMTPHNSGHTEETFAARATEIAANINRLAAGSPLGNVVRAGRARAVPDGPAVESV
ncbi:NAD(P)-dependent oxidoreductase [Streptomyces sp. DSM 41524]|uniref:NAD(P)-dependent oxidoreductase n=1 Tax=Streptomyces asiaticus subsp. ignotus TaxID=3098222 RepID=A0ABU7PUF8_9ACTN|nr:NAD(P)-dependent oxidoreductase [Streptomyces sp. DSM 41524]